MLPCGAASFLSCCMAWSVLLCMIQGIAGRPWLGTRPILIVLNDRLQSSCNHLFLSLQITSGNLEMDTKLLSDCLMSLAVFEAWQEPLYLHLVTKAQALPLAAFGPRSLRQTYQVGLVPYLTYSQACKRCFPFVQCAANISSEAGPAQTLFM